MSGSFFGFAGEAASGACATVNESAEKLPIFSCRPGTLRSTIDLTDSDCAADVSVVRIARPSKATATKVVRRFMEYVVAQPSLGRSYPCAKADAAGLAGTLPPLRDNESASHA